MRYVVVYGIVAVLLIVWGAAWTTQSIAHQLGYSEVLGAPLVRGTRQSWLLSALTHAAAALGGAGVALFRAKRRTSIALLGVASMLLLLGSGPLYSPHRAVVWGVLMQDEALVDVLWRAVGLGGVSIVWMTALIAAAVFEQKRIRDRWRGAVDLSSKPDLPLPTASSSSPSSGPNENRRESQPRASIALRPPFGTYLNERRQTAERGVDARRTPEQ